MPNPSPASSRNALASLLDQVRAGDPVACGSVTFVPLFHRPDAAEVDADLLEDGIRSGVSRVTEIDEAGSVNFICVEHGGKRPLLIVDGEQVLGAKQNRVFNASFLVPPGASVVVPVSCVERGRWHFGGPPAPARRRSEGRRTPARHSGEFIASEATLTGTGRSRKLSRVVHSTMTGRGYDADQSQVWSDVDWYLEKTEVCSMTSAYEDGYRSRADQVEQSLDAVAPRAGQVGIAAVVGDRLVGMDLFGSPGLYGRTWKKVVRGVLADVYDLSPEHRDPGKIVGAALEAAATAVLKRQTAPGCGETLHGALRGLAVGAVTLNGSVYHAFLAQG